MSISQLKIYSTWPFWMSLAILLVNDHIIKSECPGWISGKLSDFSGIFLFVLFLRESFVKDIVVSSAFIIIAFTFWKSSLSQEAITQFNNLGVFHIARVIDYTDLFALIMIPIANYVFEWKDRFIIVLGPEKIVQSVAIIITTFAITATSMAPSPRQQFIGNPLADSFTPMQKMLFELEEIVELHNLSCVQCDITKDYGEFRYIDYSMKYFINHQENSLEVHFNIDFRVIMWGYKRETVEKIDKLKNDLLLVIESNESYIRLIFR